MRSVLLSAGATLTIILLLCFAGYLIFTAEYETNNPENYVSKIVDGDTFEMSNGETIRLMCVDTPEKGEEGFEEASSFLEDMILGKEIQMNITGKDKYERNLAFVYLNDSDGIFVNSEILDFGFGELLEINSGECDILRD